VTFYIEEMHPDDVPEVSRVERLCFTNPWPQSAYRRELRNPRNNHYIVLRERQKPSTNGVEPDDEQRGRFPLLPFRRRGFEGRTGDPIVGFAGMWILFDEAHITTIGVHPDYRGLGLGEFLMVELFVEAMRRGAEMVTLEVRVSNDSAQALYQKYGFTRQGLRRRYYSDNGEDAYIMWSPRMRDPEYARHFQELRDSLDERLGDRVETVSRFSADRDTRT
jgi:[ribosomal protein S18]-alanine N-acetyltransferase